MSTTLPRSDMEVRSFEVFSPANLLLMDETVAEVFGVMLNIETAYHVDRDSLNHEEEKHYEHTAIIGFAGAISGTCEISLIRSAAVAITSAMLGGESSSDEESETICDAVGELCNMLGGGWKNRIPELTANCSLSVPIVIKGESYQVHRHAHLQVQRRCYAFGGSHQLQLTLVYDPSL